MRFILGFFFFGLLFYAIHIYFPDAFETLVSWAEKTFNFIHNFFEHVFNKPQEPMPK